MQAGKQKRFPFACVSACTDVGGIDDRAVTVIDAECCPGGLVSAVNNSHNYAVGLEEANT